MSHRPKRKSRSAARDWTPRNSQRSTRNLTEPLTAPMSMPVGDGEYTEVCRLHLKTGAKVDIRANTVRVEEDTHVVGVSVSGSRVAVPVANIDWYEGERDG